MKAVFATVALFAAAVSAQTFTVNTPTSVVECEPVQITWTGGTAPFFLSILPGGNPGGSALIDFGEEQSSPFTWSAVNVTSGTSLGITLKDSTGTTVESAAFTVQAGTSSSCLSSSGSSTSSGGATSTTSGSSTGSSTSGSSTGSSTSGSSTTSKGSTSGSSTSTATSSSSTTSSSSAAGPTLAAQYGAAGVLGVLAAAVLI